jgi:hypothetical protein
MSEEQLNDVIDLIYEVNDLMLKVENILMELDEVLLTDEEYEDNNEVMYELPRVSRISKHGFHIEYVITKITKGGDIIAKGICDDYGDEITLSVKDLNNEEAITLLNYFN